MKSEYNKKFLKIMTLDSQDLLYYLKNDSQEIFNIIPELIPMIDFKQNNPYHILNVWEHTLKALEFTPNNLVVRLAVLFHDIGKPSCYIEDEKGIGHFYGHGKVGADIAKNVMIRLELNNDIIKNVIQLIKYHDATFVAKVKYIKRWLNKIGEDQFKNLLLVKKADINGHNPIYIEKDLKNIKKIELILEDILIHQNDFTIKDLKINGKDLIDIGYNQDKSIGIVLRKLFNDVILNNVKNDRELLLNLAKKWK